MSVLKKFKKKFISKLRRIRKHYRYKVYFPKVYSSYCTEPVQENKVLFLEMRFTKLSNSFELIYKALEESGEYDLKCSYVQFNFIRGREFTQRVNEMLKELATAKYVFVDDASLILSSIPLRKETVAINLWHACGAFKKFGQRGTNLSLPEDRATHAQYNLVCVSGENLRSIYADAFDVNYNKVKALGCPRTDDYFNKHLITKTKRKIYFRHPSLIGKSVLVYAPTFRDVGCDRSEFHPELDFDRLSKDLLPNQVLLICPHPVMKNDILPKKYKNIRVMRDFSTNAYMLISDMLITDYSSVIFEYALLRKPIAFFCYDLPTYDRGFYLNYPEDLPGDVYTNQEELTDYLTHPEKHILTNKMNSFVDKYMSACDGHSCERIANLINSYMEGK